MSSLPEGCVPQDTSAYSLPLRLFSVFAVFAVSSVAVFLPVFIQRYVKSTSDSHHTTESVMLVIKQFGAGVIVATAFIHLLPDAFETFDDPCIGEIQFDAWPGLLALVGVLITFVIDNLGHRIVAERIRSACLKLEQDSAARPLLAREAGHDAESHLDSLSVDSEPSTIAALSQTPKKSGSFATFDSMSGSSSGHLHSHGGNNKGSLTIGHVHNHGHTFFELEDEDLTASIDRLSLYVLEAGIIFHSVLIGVTLSVTSESAFLSLFVVIMFHQFFEGLALGSRIMSVKSLSPSRKYFYCSWFCMITPIGMIIGIIWRGSSLTTASVSLWIMGSLNSMSAGILLWASLVELLAEEWIHGELHEASVALSTVAFFAVLCGASLMSVLGIWA
ncbi:Zinc/iron permease [Lipomyces oligophaga]|uniref:Zinc/iron permease n=1 Tax=Lipomyces oligophaga TaxID=45792 RepID=UPI0034CF7B57